MKSSYYDDDSFDYPQYWEKRRYEHLSEESALRTLIKRISPKMRQNILDIGAGFGRLTHVYADKFNHCVLLDPSKKLLSEAKERLRIKNNLEFKLGFGEDIPFKDEKFHTVLMVRVFHHLRFPEKVAKEVARVLKPGGFFILEFANKANFKAKLLCLLCCKYRKEVFGLEPVNRQSQKKSNMSTIPFVNYHPLWIDRLFRKLGFEVIIKLSSSNFRSSIFKRILPPKVLLCLEEKSQFFLGKVNFGPSIFLLLKKV